MTQKEYRILEDYMKECMTDAAHDREHIGRVLRAALKIAESEPDADVDILTAACLLHDIGREQQYADPAVSHADVGADMACRFLLEQGWAEPRAAHVSDCIRSHSFRKGAAPGSIEAKILFDADKLDACGAMGIARTLQCEGRMGEPLYCLGEEGQLLPGNPGEPESFLKEYCQKLRTLYDHFYTSAARNMAAQRREIAESFYKAILRETGLPD